MSTTRRIEAISPRPPVDRNVETLRASELPRWLSVKAIAADLGISISTAYKWSARGAPWFPRSIRLRNGDLRVRRDWYESWLVAMEDGPNAQRSAG